MASQSHAPLTGDRDNPGSSPAEIPADQGDFDQPDRAPAEVEPAGSDIDEPDTAPAETPAGPRIPDIALPPD